MPKRKRDWYGGTIDNISDTNSIVVKSIEVSGKTVLIIFLRVGFTYEECLVFGEFYYVKKR